MKKPILILIALLLGTFTSYTASNAATRPFTYDGSAYIFIEGPVEFSIFPDGQFDFVYLGYDDRGRVNVNINTANININYNSGYNYEPYLQYDDYGAVIQIEDVPIYYDQFGRIVRAGNTNIVYNDRRIVGVGGLRIFYHPWGGFNYATGYINFWTPRYIWRPWHVYYVRPFYYNCIVYDLPYRRYYNPHRYPYWRHRQLYNNGRRVAYNNGRRNFYKPGSRVHYKDGRTAVNQNFNESRRNPVAQNNPRGNKQFERGTRRLSSSTSYGKPATNNTRGEVIASRDMKRQYAKPVRNSSSRSHVTGNKISGTNRSGVAVKSAKRSKGSRSFGTASQSQKVSSRNRMSSSGSGDRAGISNRSVKRAQPSNVSRQRTNVGRSGSATSSSRSSRRGM